MLFKMIHGCSGGKGPKVEDIDLISKVVIVILAIPLAVAMGSVYATGKVVEYTLYRGPKYLVTSFLQIGRTPTYE